jgi:hypothetical protein
MANGILPRVAVRFWLYGPMLNLLKNVFFVSIHPLDRGEYMMGQNLLVDVSIEMFSSNNRPSPAKISKYLPFIQLGLLLSVP